jgi:hypothetical protein
MYKILRPFIQKLWAWHQVIVKDQPSWTFWASLYANDFLRYPTPDSTICHELIQEILHH